MDRKQKKLIKKRRRVTMGVRRRLHGMPEKPRLSVFRSNRHFYCQAIDDEGSRTLVAVSSLLTTTMTSLSEVIEALNESDLRAGVGVIVGGAPLTREYAESIGADGFADDCVSAVDEAKRLMAAR